MSNLRIKIGLKIDADTWLKFKTITNILKIKDPNYKGKDMSTIVEELIKKFVEEHEEVLKEVQ